MWKRVNIEKIQNCFCIAGSDKDINESFEFDDEKCFPLLDLQMLIRGCEEYHSIDQYVNSEDELITVEIENTDSEIKIWLEVSNKVATTAEALKYLKTLKIFLQISFKGVHCLKQLESSLNLLNRRSYC